MNDFDPAAVMAEHHPADSRKWQGPELWCSVCVDASEGADGYIGPVEWPCLSHLLAKALTRSDGKVAKVEALRKRYAFLGGDWSGFADDLHAALAD